MVARFTDDKNVESIETVVAVIEILYCETLEFRKTHETTPELFFEHFSTWDFDLRDMLAPYPDCGYSYDFSVTFILTLPMFSCLVGDTYEGLTFSTECLDPKVA